MAPIDSVTANLDAEVMNANNVMECTLECLYKNGYLTAEQADEFAYKYGIVIIKRKWYQRMFKENHDKWFYRCVRIQE